MSVDHVAVEKGVDAALQDRQAGRGSAAAWAGAAEAQAPAAGGDDGGDMHSE